MTGSSKAGAKKATIAELSGHFASSTAAVLTEYRGLTVSEITELRRTLGTTTTYTVSKNTLTKIAASQAGVSGLDDLLVGPTAVAFVTGDPVEAAKALRAFSKEHAALVLKGGFMDGQALTAAEIGKLADLESREVLLSKLAGAMNATMSKAAALFQAPLSKTARTIEAFRAQVEASTPAEAPAAAPAEVEAPAAEAQAPVTADA